MKAKNNKPVNRTASIINRSKLLMLSDSESDNEDVLDKKRFSKHLRISKPKSYNLKSKSYIKMLCKGKRKRNSASEMGTSNSLFAASTSTSGLNEEKLSSRCKGDSMECDHCDSSSSELSDSPTECNFDGDDEQSDFYDCSTSHTPRSRNRNYCHSKPLKEFKKPVNPFFTVDLESHHSASINLWKRRRPLH